MNHLDLFSGIGGFSLAASWVWGKEHNIVSFVEINKSCQGVLKKHWPSVSVHNDIRNYKPNGTPIDIITGGDPCPIRSRARSNGETKHSDLSGYFLSLVGRLRPRWVVRENVPASDDKDFTASLEMLGYGAIIIRTNSDTFTGQCRQRDFIIGCNQGAWQSYAKYLPVLHDGKGAYTTKLGTRQITPALTTHRTRYDSRDCYIFDGRLRLLDGDERTALAGFPKGWLTGISEAGIAKMTGNAIVPQVVAPIMQAIKEIENGI